MKFTAIVPILFLAAAPAYPQRICFGARAGVPLNDAFKAIQNPTPFNLESKRYTVGPTVEVRLIGGLWVEADALYRTVEYSTVSGRTWEFPLLAKYVHGGGRVRPFLNGGFSFHRLSGLSQFARTLSVEERTNTGAVAGGGLELRLPFIKISPEIRYTRWGGNLIPAALAEFTSNRNQAVFLVGITF